MAQTVKRLSTMWKTQVQALGREDPLEKEMAIHPSTIAWKIPWTEESGRLQYMGSQRVDTTERLHFNSSYIFWMLDPYQICNLQIFPPILFYFLYYVH